MARHWPNSAIGRPCDPCLELAAACHAEPLPLIVYTSCDDLASLARPSDHTHSTPSPEGCSGQRACTHAQLGISETAHGPTLEYRQLLHGSSTHSQCKSRGSIETARAIYAHALTIFPSKRPMSIVSLRGSHIRHSIHLLFTPRRVLNSPPTRTRKRYAYSHAHLRR